MAEKKKKRTRAVKRAEEENKQEQPLPPLSEDAMKISISKATMERIRRE